MTEISTDAPRTSLTLNLFERGFRPFFLLAGLHAALAIFAWVAVLQGWFDAPPSWPPTTLHAHEMIFGFASAAVAGFLLTAVPSWTGSGPVRGWRLVALVLVWLAGRGAAFAGADAKVFAVLDLAFIPALLGCVAPGIVARNLSRNGVVVVLLCLILAANVGVHLAVLGAPWVSARWGNELGLAIFILLIAIIGGRIVPPFTVGGMRMAGRPVEIKPTPSLDRAAMIATAAWASTLALDLPDAAVGAAAGLAALANGARLLRWRSLQTIRVPLVWVLHLGYGWLVVGLALTAGAWFADLWPKAAALHALGAGAVATMILAVISRASLGHTGRRLEAGRWTVASYALVSLGALGRAAGSVIAGWPMQHVLAGSGILWAAGFALFSVVYAPILLRRRVDGRPG